MRYSDKDEEVRQTLKRIEALKNAANMNLVDINRPETHELKITVNNKVKHGMFYPHPDNPGEWYATDQTYKAMKKNIFAVGDSIDELKEPYTCSSCKSDLDKQFWHFCPYCGKSFEV